MQYDSTAEYFARRRTKSTATSAASTPATATDKMVAIDTDVSIDDGEENDNENIPVTPGISHFSYLDPMNATHLSSRNIASETRHNSSTAESNESRRPISPTEAARGAKTGEELLRRLSLAAQRSPDAAPVDVDPRSGHEGLSLSGHVISATFTVPYKIAHKPGEAWVGD